MKSAAIEHNIRDVGELPLSKQVEAATGKPCRLVKISRGLSAVPRHPRAGGAQGRLALFTLWRWSC